MADAFLTPIIDEMVTILQANLPGEIDAIDTNLDDIKNEFFHKAWMQHKLQFPAMEIFPSGNNIINPQYTHGLLDFDWRIATVINFGANDEEEGERDAQTYFTAVIKSLEKGTIANNEFKFNGTVRKAGPIGVDFVNGGQAGNILTSVIIMWEAQLSEDPLA